MNIRFAGNDLSVRQVRTTPNRFKLGDILSGPEGMLLKVVTVQKACPYIENINHYRTVIVLETEAREIIPVDGMDGEYELYRTK